MMYKNTHMLGTCPEAPPLMIYEGSYDTKI